MSEPFKPWKKIFKKIAIGLVIFLGLLAVFTTFFLKNIVDNQLQKQIKSTFGDFYQLSFEESATALSASGFSINFQKVSFEADTSNLFMLTKYPAIFFETDLLQINDIHVLNLLFGSNIKVRTIQIDEPQLLFYIPKNNMSSDSTGSQGSKNFIENISVKNISINNGSASFVFDENRSDTLFTAKHLSLNIENLGLDIKSDQSLVKTATLDQLEFSLKEFKVAPLHSDYTYAIETMKFNYQEELFHCSNLSVDPVGNPRQMASRGQFRKSILSIKVDSLAYQSSDFQSLKNLDSINGRSLKIMGLDLVIDRNKSIPLNQSIHKKLFHESLLDLPIAINLDSIQITDASIDYRIHSNSSKNYGNLLLTQVDGNITNIHSEELSEIQAKFDGVFMKGGPFNLNLQLPLKTPRQHTYNGHIGAMDFTALNPLISNLTKVRMEEGRIQRIEFQGKGGNLLNQGHMQLAFNDLKLSVMNESNKKKWFQSGLGNLLIRNNNRTKDNQNTDSIQYSYERPHYKDHLDLYGGGLINGFAHGVLPKAIYSLVMGN